MARDFRIDFLRGCALLLLVVAHTSAPSWLAATRTFDVPLMVFLSAMCLKGTDSYGRYCMRRFKRIYIPTAQFLTILFVLSAFLPIVPSELMTPEIIAGSYLLWNWPAIPFVWIMRVFLMMALVMPLLDKAVRRLGTKGTLPVLAAAYILQNIACAAIDPEGREPLTFFIRDYVLYLCGYSIIACVGLSLRKADKKCAATVLAASAAAIAVWSIGHSGFDPQASKYPPSSLYISYGITCAVALYMLSGMLKRPVGMRFWQYLSANSMWLYLWHTLPVFVLRGFNLFPGSWGARFAFVLAGGLLLKLLYDKTANFAAKRIVALKNRIMASRL